MFTLISTVIMIPVSLLPTAYFMPSGQPFGGYIYTVVALLAGLYFLWQGIRLYDKRDIASAKKLMYASFLYLPLLQLTLLFDFIAK